MRLEKNYAQANGQMMLYTIVWISNFLKNSNNMLYFKKRTQCDILRTRIFANKIIIKSAREIFMKKILLSFGCCLILTAVLVIAKISVKYYFPQLKNSDTLSYVLYFIFAVVSILIIRHSIKN